MKKTRKKWPTIMLCFSMMLSVLLLSINGCSTAPSDVTVHKAEEITSVSEASSTTMSVAKETTEKSMQENLSAITVIDHNGDKVILPAEINRIAVTGFYPFPSVLAMFLGSAEKIIGIHPVSMSAAKNGILSKIFPEILNASTGYMEGNNLNIEELMKLNPDVVFYSAMETMEKEMLKTSGIPAVGISATKWNYDVIRTYDEWIAILSQIFPKQDKAELVSRYSKETYEAIQKKTKNLKNEERTRALFLFRYDDSTMITSGKNFFGQYWAEAAGGINVAENLMEENKNAIINMEQVYEWNPDIIYITNFTPTQPDDLYGNKIGGDDWSNVKAVVEKRVYKMPLGSYRTYTPGVDTPLTLLWIAKTMYPVLFKDVDIEEEVKSYYQKIYGVTLTDEDIAAMYAPSSEAAGGFATK